MLGGFLIVLATPPLRTLFGIVLPTPLVWLAALGIATQLVAALELGWRASSALAGGGGPADDRAVAWPGAVVMTNGTRPPGPTALAARCCASESAQTGTS